MAIRLSFFLLVLANLIFLAWTQGHFGGTDDSREPQRLTQQLHAEKLRIVRSAKAPPAKKGEMACRAIDGLGTADAEVLESTLVAAGMEARRFPQAEPKIHLVVIPDLSSKAAADKKSAELVRFGVTEQKTVALPDGRHEIVLGRFQTEAAASEFLLGLTRRNIKSARTDSRDQPVLRTRIEVRAPASILLPQLPRLVASHADAALAECAP